MRFNRKGFFFIYTVLFIFFSFALFTFSPHFFSGTGAGSEDLSLLIRLSHFIPGALFLLFGWGAYLSIVLGLSVYVILFDGFRFFVDRRRFFLGIALLAPTLLFATVLFTGDRSFSGGGIVFGMLDDFIKILFGILGELFVLFFLSLSSSLLIFDISFRQFVNFVSEFFRSLFITVSFKSSDERPPLISPVLVDSFYSQPVCDPVKDAVKDDNLEVFDYSSPDDDSDNNSDIDSVLVSGSLGSIEKEREEGQEEGQDRLNFNTDIPFSGNKEEGRSLLSSPCSDEEEEDVLDLYTPLSSFDSEELGRLNLYTDIPVSNTTDLVSASTGLVFNGTVDLVERDVIPKEDLITSSESHELIVLSDNDIDSADIKVLSNTREAVSTDNLNSIDNSSSDIESSLYSCAKSSFFLTEDSSDSSVCGVSSGDESSDGVDILEEEKLSISEKLENTLKEFGISARVVNVSCGPVIMRYEILPAPGIRLSKISGLQDNIALALASSRIRVLAPIPGKSLVGIEIPNKTRQLVTLGELINSREFSEDSRILPIALGKGIDGQILVSDLVSMPHLLIAGATGSGKSVFVNTLICGLLHSTPASKLRLLLIDPKRVELSIYNGIPNLLAPVITDPQKALFALKWVVEEMERRYKLLEKYGVRDIKGFNKKVLELKSQSYATDDCFEYIVVIIDEFADLMMTSSKEVEGQVSRLAAMSRAVGIHLVVATQRPSVDVITGLIKANFPARIAFQVSSKMESRIILDGNGADKLLGKGDLLFLSPGSWGNVRVQGAFLKEDEIMGFVDYLKGPTNYVDELENITVDDVGGAGDKFALDDNLYTEAVELVRAEGKASASYLQRKMRIGYNRAARMIEVMEDEGIVSGQNGSKAREVFI